AYERSLERQAPAMQLTAAACPSFVPLVERGVTAGAEIERAAKDYLAPLLAAEIDTLILGCTHYPLLAGLLQLVCGPDVVLVSSAEETAKDVYAVMTERGLAAPTGEAKHTFLSTGDAARFAELATVFLGPEIDSASVTALSEAAWS
ncbi:MAG TPA: glutamate racemase, partial [Actinomycetota bacterium]|nr:glutamate racemase [Actinomycetota bacterium]